MFNKKIYQSTNPWLRGLFDAEEVLRELKSKALGGPYEVWRLLYSAEGYIQGLEKQEIKSKPENWK